MKHLVKFRNILLEKLTHSIAVPSLMRFRKREPFHYTMKDLEQFPEGTVGKDLAEYLNKVGLKLMKNYERHDCKHIIFGYEMDQWGEAAMQFYFFGNGLYTVPVVSSVIAYGLLVPENRRAYYKEFRKGRKGKKLTSLNAYQPNQLVLMKTKELRSMYLNQAV